MMGRYFFPDEGILFQLDFAAAAVGKEANAVLSEDSVVVRKSSRDSGQKERPSNDSQHFSVVRLSLPIKKRQMPVFLLYKLKKSVEDDDRQLLGLLNGSKWSSTLLQRNKRRRVI